MFTIIIPTHKRPTLLSRALQSVAAQTCRNFKVIVVDDAASYIPPYADLANLQGKYTFVIRSDSAAGGGPAPSRNLALDLLATDYLMFLDDDDTLAPNHLEAMAQRLSLGPVPLLFCDFNVVNEDRTVTPPKLLSSDSISLQPVTRESVYVLNRIPNSCLVYHRDVVKGLRFDTTLEIYEDWDFLLQCLKNHNPVHVPGATVNIHKSLADAPENMRRGNSRHDLTASVMMELYRRHPAPDMQTRQARVDLLKNAGVDMD